MASDVFPTFDAYVFGKPAMIPSSIESVTSAMMKSAIVICRRPRKTTKRRVSAIMNTPGEARLRNNYVP